MSFTPPLFIEMSVPIPESRLSSMYVLEVSTLPLSRTITTVWYLLKIFKGKNKLKF